MRRLAARTLAIALDDATVARYIGAMAESSPAALTEETEAERRDRLAWEAEGIAKARASAAAGRVVDSAKVKAWIDSIGTDHELPVPYSGR